MTVERLQQQVAPSIRHYARMIVALGVALMLAVPTALSAQSDLSLRGTVVSQETGDPLIGATVKLVETGLTRKTDSAGGFVFDNLPPAAYHLRITHVGYTVSKVDVHLTATSRKILAVVLKPAPVPLPGITVRPRRHNPSSPVRLGATSFSHDELRTLPQFGEDIYRAATRLPGVTGNHVSSRFMVRGSEHDQVLVTLDGMELEEPFHLKGVDGGVLSIIDIAAIKDIDLATGGFGAEFGDRLAGVFNLETRDIVATDPNYGLSISLTNMRANAEGTFAQGRGAWLGSARRGYIDLVTDFSEHFDELRPRYYDAFAKTTYQLTPGHRLSGYILHAHDDLLFSEDRSDNSEMAHDDTYSWLTWSARWSNRVSTRSIVSGGQLFRDRTGSEHSFDHNPPNYDVFDQRDYRFYGIKQDWEIRLAPAYAIHAGWDWKSVRTEYSYRKEAAVYTYYSRGSLAWLVSEMDTTITRLSARGETWAGYLTNQIRPWSRLLLNLGLRYDANSYADDRILNPRTSFEYQLFDRTTVRFAWGTYSQAQRIYELAIPDQDHTFYPAERSEHRVLGLLHQLTTNTELRIELYDKRQYDLRPEYRNWLETVFLFPEAAEDRVLVNRSDARSRGIEFYLARSGPGRLNWRLSYALAEVTETIAGYYETGLYQTLNQQLPGRYDQRHAVALDLAWQPAPGWAVATAWQYRTGWPYTEAELAEFGTINVITAGELSGARYDAYSRLDFRISREFKVGNGDIRLFFEVMNLLNQSNTRIYAYELYCNGPDCELEKQTYDWLGIVPSVGIAWRFGS